MGWQLDDLPAMSPAFHFADAGKVLAECLQEESAHAFVLGIHGPWGCGKSTLMGAVRAALPVNSIFVDFNAWKFGDREALWRALIIRVLEALREAGGDEATIREMQRSLYAGFAVDEKGGWKVDWTALATEATLTAMRIATANMAAGWIDPAGKWLNTFFNRKPKADDTKLDDVAKSIERAGGILSREVTVRSVDQVKSIEQFLDRFRDLVAKLAAGRRTYVLIDDLDRCLPEASLEIFEAIKLFMDAPECTYVIALDRDVIRKGLAVRYSGSGNNPVDPDEYIEKTITLSFDVSPLTVEDSADLLAGCLVELELNRNQLRSTLDVLGSNPRRIKRFARLLRLTAKLRGALAPYTSGSVDDMFLKLTLISYCNSGVFGLMQREIDLACRLQDAVNQRANNLRTHVEAATVESRFAESLSREANLVWEAKGDHRLWNAFAMSPPFDHGDASLQEALSWFRAPVATPARPASQ